MLIALELERTRNTQKHNAPHMGVEEAGFVSTEGGDIPVKDVANDGFLESFSSSNDYDSVEDSSYRPLPISDTNDGNKEAYVVHTKMQKGAPKKKGVGQKKAISKSYNDGASFEAAGYASYSE